MVQLNAQKSLTNTITLNSINIINPEKVQDAKATIAKSEHMSDPETITADLRKSITLTEDKGL